MTFSINTKNKTIELMLNFSKVENREKHVKIFCLYNEFRDYLLNNPQNLVAFEDYFYLTKI